MQVGRRDRSRGPRARRRPAIDIARSLAAKPVLYRALQKQTLSLNLRRRIVQDVPFGTALEGLTAADLPYQSQA
jgi:hypothetical protein